MVLIYVPLHKSITAESPILLGSEYDSYDRAFEVGNRSPNTFIKVLTICVSQGELDCIPEYKVPEIEPPQYGAWGKY